ncbi:MAG TPA: succinate dehydrogenase, cytochrome b556 subunit [Casimicrobiaceae bacterium]
MAAADRPLPKPRPIYLNLLAIRQPVPAVISILHRISGVLLIVVGIPVLLWFVEASLASPERYAAVYAALTSWFGKLVLLMLAWSVFHHILAGIRHLLLDIHLGLDLAPARRSAAVVLVVALLLTLACAVRLW